MPQHSGQGIRRNIYLDPETDTWLTAQGATRGGRSAVIRALVEEARARGGLPSTGGGLSSEDRAALVDQVSREVLAALRASLPGVPSESSSGSPATGDQVDQAEEVRRRAAARKTAGRFINRED